MKAVDRYISLLHEIVMDFVVVFIDLIQKLRGYVRTISLTKVRVPTFPKKYVVPRNQKETCTSWKELTFIKRYVGFLSEIYSELEHATDNGSFPGFLVVSILLIIVLCCALFYKALVW